MNKTEKIILGIFIVLLLLALGIVQLTGTGTIFGIGIKIPFLIPDNNSLTSNVPISSPDIKITSFEPEKKIYAPGEQVRVNFKVENTYEEEVPYEISVNWFFNNSRYAHWENMSTEIYNSSNGIKSFYSYLIIDKKGSWEVQLLTNYTIQNYPIVKEEIATFEVI